MIHLEQNVKYVAYISLGFFEKIASNDTIKGKLENAGFKDVVVVGGGGARQASGVWTLPTQDAELPSQVVSVHKVQ